jgi:two-component system, OmpR family, sensor histidine kinase VanS
MMFQIKTQQNVLHHINRHSIRVKLTLTLTALIVITIFLLWCLNRTFLVEYYLHSKIDTLGNTFDEVNHIIKNMDEESGLSNDEFIKIERLGENSNVSIYIISRNLDWIYPKSKNTEEEFLRILSIFRDYIFGGTNPNVKSKEFIASNDVYSIYKIFDSRLESNYVELFGILNGDNIILMRTNLESMHESVIIANKFLSYVGVIAVIIGTIIMFYISKRFTKPILQLAGIAKKMSDLDFDIKYNVTTEDEIGELGGSINILSEKLESTISELKVANNELLSDIQDKIQIDEMRKDFLSNVTHELKTPIALIQGYAEGLKDNINDDEESREFYCDVIVDEARKMNNMVKKLLSLNQIEFGKNTVNIERFDIVTLIKSVLNSTEILFQQKGALLHFDYSEPCYVWADEYMVEEVVTNYISNALNHVDDPRIIEIKLIQKENVIRVAVFNTGANIPEEDIDKIWIKFYKVDKARTREYGGSGIGLSIVKAIMTSHNQECGVINHETGVEFWFELDTKIE